MLSAKIKIKKLTDTAKTPTRGSEYAAGYDLYADVKEDVQIDMDDVMQTNIDKLKARYPEGFSADRSLHRKEGDI